MRIALFVTCVNDVAFPSTGIAAVRVLERLGVEVDFPEAQTCCGQMQYNTGYPDESQAAGREVRARAMSGATTRWWCRPGPAGPSSATSTPS